MNGAKKKKLAFGIASDRSFPDLLFPHNMIFFSAPIPTKDLIQQPQDLPISVIVNSNWIKQFWKRTSSIGRRSGYEIRFQVTYLLRVMIWFVVLCASVGAWWIVIGQIDCFGNGFTKLNWKPLFRFTAVKHKNLRHIRLSVPWKSVSVQSVCEAKFIRKLCWKYSDKTKYAAIKSEVNKQELLYRYSTFKASLSRNCFIFWRFEKVFWISQ